MPVRRRKSKARAGEAEAWSMFLMAGYDFFDDLAAVGLTEEDARPLAAETWRRIGHDVVAHLDHMHIGFTPYSRPIWAEREFGPPAGRKRRALRA
jgi:hypothetical protein